MKVKVLTTVFTSIVVIAIACYILFFKSQDGTGFIEIGDNVAKPKDSTSFYNFPYNADFEPIENFDKLAETQKVIEIANVNIPGISSMKNPTDPNDIRFSGADIVTKNKILKERITAYKKNKQGKIIVHFKSKANGTTGIYSENITDYFLIKREIYEYNLNKRPNDASAQKLFDELADLYLTQILYLEADAIAVNLDKNGSLGGAIGNAQFEVIKRVQQKAKNLLLYIDVLNSDADGYGMSEIAAQIKDILNIGIKIEGFRISLPNSVRELDLSPSAQGEAFFETIEIFQSELEKQKLPAPHSDADKIWSKITIILSPEIPYYLEKLGNVVYQRLDQPYYLNKKILEALMGFAKEKGIKNYALYREILKDYSEVFTERDIKAAQALSEVKAILQQK